MFSSSIGTLSSPATSSIRQIGKGAGGGELDQEEREVTYKEVKTIVYHKEKKIWLKQHPSYNSENSFYQLSRENQAIMVRLRTAWTLLGKIVRPTLRLWGESRDRHLLKHGFGSSVAKWLRN